MVFSIFLALIAIKKKITVKLKLNYDLKNLRINFYFNKG